MYLYKSAIKYLSVCLSVINTLMDRIENNKYCYKLNSVTCGCPTSADDMVLLSNTKHGLDSLIEQCYLNSTRERDLYNPYKCNVVVFNDKNKSPNRSWKIGNEVIKESDSYVHLGVQCNKSMDLTDNINQSCDKLRKTFFSMKWPSSIDL